MSLFFLLVYDLCFFSFVCLRYYTFILNLTLLMRLIFFLVLLHFLKHFEYIFVSISLFLFLRKLWILSFLYFNIFDFFLFVLYIINVFHKIFFNLISTICHLSLRRTKFFNNKLIKIIILNLLIILLLLFYNNVFRIIIFIMGKL